jgi:hypothetical protein
MKSCPWLFPRLWRFDSTPFARPLHNGIKPPHSASLLGVEANTAHLIPKLLRDHEAADATVHDAGADAPELWIENI